MIWRRLPTTPRPDWLPPVPTKRWYGYLALLSVKAFLLIPMLILFYRAYPTGISVIITAGSLEVLVLCIQFRQHLEKQ